jgi:murein DD-endopeptidase MepM/ murein hydrolase activator NlpD
VVDSVGLACRSQRLADGGRTVKLAVQKRQGAGPWIDTGAWVLYAHLDPVSVGVGEVVIPGQSIGAMGPAFGPEYNSSCAQGSHVHIEASRARCVVNQQAVIRNAPVLAFDV